MSKKTKKQLDTLTDTVYECGEMVHELGQMMHKALCPEHGEQGPQMEQALKQREEQRQIEFVVSWRTAALMAAVQAHHEYGVRGEGGASAIVGTAREFVEFLRNG